LLEALDVKAAYGGDDRVRVGALADYVGLRVPEITKASFGIEQLPTRKLSGNDFPIGVRQAVLGTANEGPAIPKDPTHVMVRAEFAREKPSADAPGSIELRAGTQVRVVEFSGNWVVIAREGQKLGYVPADAVLKLQ
jgi:hypothetical protein